MIEREMRLITAEAVRRGHPDKFCDQIADAILDAHLNEDPKARVAVEIMATAGRIAVAGEVSSSAEVDYEAIVAEVIRKIGYKWQDLCENDEDKLSISIGIHEQSPDIAAAVDGRFPGLDLGAGDQGIVYGFASDETLPRLPLPYMIAQRICVLLDEAGREIPWMGVDGKAQVSIKYTETCPYIQTIIVSVQHSVDAPDKELRAALIPISLWSTALISASTCRTALAPATSLPSRMA